MGFPRAWKLELLVAITWEPQPADSAYVLESLPKTPVVTWADVQSHARTSAEGRQELLSMDLSTSEVNEGHWHSGCLQGRQQPVLPVDSQNIKVSSSTKTQVEDVLGYWKLKVDGGEGLHTVMWEAFLNAFKGASAYSVSTDCWLCTLPLNSREEGCQFNSNLCKILIKDLNNSH